MKFSLLMGEPIRPSNLIILVLCSLMWLNDFFIMLRRLFEPSSSLLAMEPDLCIFSIDLELSNRFFLMPERAFESALDVLVVFVFTVATPFRDF